MKHTDIETTARVHRLADAIGDAKDEYIEAASPEHAATPGHATATTPKTNARGLPIPAKRAATRYGAIAASFLLILSGTLLLSRITERVYGGSDGAAAEKVPPTNASTTDAYHHYTTGAADTGAVDMFYPDTPTENDPIEDAVVEEEAADAGMEKTTVEAPAPSWDESTEKENADEPDLFIPARDYHDHILTAEIGYLWSWNDLTDAERYSTFYLDGETYNAAYTQIGGVYRDAVLGTGTAVGYDNITSKEYKASMTAYAIKGIEDNRLISVYIEEAEADYLYRKSAFDPPATLGELIEAYSMKAYLVPQYWHENGDTVTAFALGSDMLARMWDTVSAVADAPFVPDAYGVLPDTDAITFPITSAVYGIRNRELTITADGYLHTNAFDFGYTYYIGADIAAELLDEIRKNSPMLAADMYTSDDTIVGTVKTVTVNGDGTYTITVDDTPACKNPADGLTFTVRLTEQPQTRFFTNKVITVGDTVRLTYGRAINRETLLVDFVTDIHPVTIAPKNTVIPR